MSDVERRVADMRDMYKAEQSKNVQHLQTIADLTEQLKAAEAKIAMLEDPTPPEHEDKTVLLHHRKRGTDYTVEDDHVRVQCSSGPLQDGEFVVLYRDVVSGHRSIRRAAELTDGRFEMREGNKTYNGIHYSELLPAQIRDNAFRAFTEVPRLHDITTKDLDCILITLWLYGLKLAQGRDAVQATPAVDSPALREHSTKRQQ